MSFFLAFWNNNSATLKENTYYYVSFYANGHFFCPSYYDKKYRNVWFTLIAFIFLIWNYTLVKIECPQIDKRDFQRFKTHYWKKNRFFKIKKKLCLIIESLTHESIPKTLLELCKLKFSKSLLLLVVVDVSSTQFSEWYGPMRYFTVMQVYILKQNVLATRLSTQIL